MANTNCSVKIPNLSAAFISQEGHELLSAIKAPRYIEYINILFGRVFVKEYLNSNSFNSLSDFSNDKTASSVNGKLNNMYNQVKDELNSAILSEEFENVPETTVLNIIKIVENWDLFTEYHASYNSFVSIDEAAFAEKEYFDRNGNEYHEFELVSNEVMTAFKFFPKADVKIGTNGELIITEAIDPNDGLPMAGDFENIFKLTLDYLKGTKDEGEFISKLTSKELQIKIPEIFFLNRILPLDENSLKNLTRKQRLLLNSIYTTFSRDYVPVRLSETQNFEEEGKLPIHKRFQATKGNNKKILNSFTSNFSNNREENEYVKADNSENTDSAQFSGFGMKRLYKLPAKLPLIQINDDDLNNTSIFQIQKDYKDYFDVLKIIGVEFSDMSLLESLDQNIKLNLKRNLIQVLNSTRNITDNLNTRIDNGKRIFNPINSLLTYDKYIDKDTKEEKTIIKLKNIINNIVRLEGHFTKISPTSMSRGPSGEKKSDITYSSAISIASNQLNSSKSLTDLFTKSYFTKLKYNPLHKYSFTVNNIVGTDNQYILADYSGQINKVEEDSYGSDTKNLLDIDKFKSDVNNLLGYGEINGPQLESKSGYFSNLYLDKNSNTIIPFSATNFETGFVDNINSNFTEQILNYLRGELDRVKHHNEIKNKRYLVPEAFGKLHIFEGILTEDQINELNSTPNWDNNHKIIREAMPLIEDFFEGQLEKMKSFISKNSIDNFISTNALVRQGFDEELFNSSKDKFTDQLLRTFIANDFIYNVEFGILISGDPLYFEKEKDGKITSDYHKRLGGLGSTGTAPANTQNLRDFFNMDEEKIFWNNYSLRGIMNEDLEEKDKVRRRDNFDTFQSAVISEDIVSKTAYNSEKMISDYIHSTFLSTGKKISKKKAQEDLKTKGLKISKGDGQGYLNLDAHRELSIKQNRWTPKHDVIYKYEALVFKRDILGKKLTESEQGDMDEFQSKIYLDPEQYALPILKQTYYGTLANEEVELDAKIFDKFSLFPLLPSIAKNNTKQKELLVAMAMKQIYYVKYKSGTKAYVRKEYTNVQDLLSETKGYDLLKSDLLKLQITPPKIEKTETKIPTQTIKLIFSNLFDGSVSNPAVIEARDRFIDNLKKIQEQSREDVFKKLGFTIGEEGNIESWDKAKIIKSLVNQVNLQKLPFTFLEAFKVDETGEFLNAIETSGLYQNLINYVTGQLDSNLREFKMTGGDFILVSDSMFKEPLKYIKLNQDNTSIEDMEVRLSLTKEYVKLLNIEDPINESKKIGTIERLNELLKNKDFVEKHKRELTIQFSRPPVQGQNSMGVGTIKEFLSPTAGNILVLPVEFMHQAGIDFDYDKEKVLAPALHRDGTYLSVDRFSERKKELEEKYQWLRDLYNHIDEQIQESEDYTDYDSYKNTLTGTDAFTKLAKIYASNEDLISIGSELIDLEDLVDEYIRLEYNSRNIIKNNLLQSMIDGLRLPEQYAQLVLPNNDSIVKPLAIQNGKDIDNLNTLPTGKSVYTYQENLKVFKMFNDAKSLLGAFALENVFSQLIAPLDITINLDYSKDENGEYSRRVNNMLLNNKDRAINISKVLNEGDEVKQNLYSQFINATVDSAKDPYFANFMLSFDNINTAVFMLSLGYPIQTVVDFISSAIVRKYVDIKNKNRGKGLKPEDLVYLTLTQSNMPVRSKGYTIEDIMSIDSALIEKDNSKVVDNLSKMKNSDSLDNKDLRTEHQKILFNFVALSEHAKEYKNFKGLFGNDTNKVTSLHEISSNVFRRDLVESTGMFSIQDIEKVEEQSTITAFRNDDIIKNILTEIFPLLSDYKVVNTLGNLYNTSKDSINERDQKILTQIITNDYISSILFTFGNYKDQNIFEYGKNLVRKVKNPDKTYSTTLVERLYKFKNTEDFKTLTKAFPVLDRISPLISEKPVAKNPIYERKYGFNVTLDIDPNIPVFQVKSYMLQFKALMNGEFTIGDENFKEEVVDILKDVFIAGLIQSGFNKAGLSFVNYAPIDFIQSLLRPAIESYNDLQDNESAFTKFLVGFTKQFKYNNPSFYRFKKEERSKRVKNNHLGKNLRVIPQKNEVLPQESTQPTTNQQSYQNEFTYDNKTIGTEFNLGEDQTKALVRLIDFVKDGNEKDVITLQGAAGTGKTAIIGYLQKYLGSKYSFAYMAPTHAATAELAFSTSKIGNQYLPSTIASSLVLNASEGTYKFTAKIKKRLGYNPVIVVDESSMLSPEDVNNLEEAIEDIGGKLIFLGDEKQIPKVDKNNVASKTLSTAFTNFEKISLNKVFRQTNNDLLTLLGEIRDQTDFKLFKVENSNNVKFVNRKLFNKELISDLESNPENTVVISYTNSSVQGINQMVRKILGRDGETVVGDIVVGYLGYASKQIEKGHVANSISYTIDKIESNGSAKVLYLSSKKLGKLKSLGIEGINSGSQTTYYQLTDKDSLTFDDLNKDDFNENNKTLSEIFAKLNKATVDFNTKQIRYGDYLDIIADISQKLASYSVGNDYVYNPSTDKMELYDKVKHKNIKTNGQGSLLFNKDIDYGHAITIHKSQGTTIENVYFDASTLKSASNTPVLDENGKQVTTERQSLAYVAMSRSKNKLVVDTGDLDFEEIPLESQEKVVPLQETVDTTTINQLSEYTNHSGGALGADTEWDKIGKKFGMVNNNHYYTGTKGADNAPNGNFEISETDVTEGQKKVTIAARQMGRIQPTHQVRDVKLIRNWAQVKYADAVFAISEILGVGDKMNYGKEALIVQGKGGTGYAMQMAINEGKPVYMFDQRRKVWVKNINGVWSKSEVPVLTPNFAGIGTREINDAGKQAIRDVYKKTKESLPKEDNNVVNSQDSKSEVQNIYSQLGNKTTSENVRITRWADLKDSTEPFIKIYGSIIYIISTRVKGTDKHFGNPFSHDPAGKTQGLIKTETIQEAVEKYIDWVLNSDEKRAQWIREQLKTGELKDKSILYFKELGEPSHATALDYLINKYKFIEVEDDSPFYSDEELKEKGFNVKFSTEQKNNKQYQLNSKEKLDPAIKELDSYLLNFFKQFGVKSKEFDNLKEKLGVDALGATDVLNKLIWLNKNRNAETVPEEVGHMAVMLMGENNPIIRDLLVEITQWSEYQSIKDQYMPIYNNEKQVKIEAIGKLIAKSLVKNYKASGLNKSLLEKALNFIENLIESLFGSSNLVDAMRYNERLADHIAINILSGNSNYLNKFTNNYKKLDYNEVIKNNSFAQSLIENFTSKNAKLTGSIAIAGQGEVIYRDPTDPIHDIDFNVDSFEDYENLKKEVEKLNGVPYHFGWNNAQKDYITYAFIVPEKGLKVEVLKRDFERGNGWVTEYRLVDKVGNPVLRTTKNHVAMDFFVYKNGNANTKGIFKSYTDIYKGKMTLSPLGNNERFFQREKDQKDYVLSSPKNYNNTDPSFVYYQLDQQQENLNKIGFKKGPC